MRSRNVVLGGLVWSVAWFGSSFASNPPTDEADRSASLGERYETAIVGGAEIVRKITATGAVTAEVNVEVGSQLSGVVDRLLVDFNDTVRKGQILAELDDREVRARLDAATAALAGAKAQVAIAKAKLQRAQADLDQAHVQAAVFAARVDRAKILEQNAERAASRKATLQRQGVVAAADAQDTGARSLVAAAAVREAEAAYRAQMPAAKGAQADFARVRAELEAADAEVLRLTALREAAELDLDNTKIRSPIDGVVVGRNVTVGQTITSRLEAKTLFVLAADLRNMEVYARVDESDIAQIKPGEPAAFTVDAYPGRQFSATVKQVRKAPVVLQNVVTYVVVLNAPNEDLSLLPGMTAVARIETTHAVADKAIPLSALRFRPDIDGLRAPRLLGEQAVWVLRDGRLSQVKVTLGAQDDREALVVKGELRPGDVVLTGPRKRAGAAPGEG